MARDLTLAERGVKFATNPSVVNTIANIVDWALDVAKRKRQIRALHYPSFIQHNDNIPDNYPPEKLFKPIDSGTTVKPKSKPKQFISTVKRDNFWIYRGTRPRYQRKRRRRKIRCCRKYR